MSVTKRHFEDRHDPRARRLALSRRREDGVEGAAEGAAILGHHQVFGVRDEMDRHATIKRIPAMGGA